MAIGPEEAHGPLFLLKGLDRTVEQDTIEAAIVKTNAILVMLQKGVHGHSSVVRHLEHTSMDAFSYLGYQGRSPCLVGCDGWHQRVPPAPEIGTDDSLGRDHHHRPHRRAQAKLTEVRSDSREGRLPSARVPEDALDA